MNTEEFDDQMWRGIARGYQKGLRPESLGPYMQLWYRGQHVVVVSCTEETYNIRSYHAGGTVQVSASSLYDRSVLAADYQCARDWIIYE